MKRMISIASIACNSAVTAVIWHMEIGLGSNLEPVLTLLVSRQLQQQQQVMKLEVYIRIKSNRGRWVGQRRGKKIGPHLWMAPKHN